MTEKPRERDIFAVIIALIHIAETHENGKDIAIKIHKFVKDTFWNIAPEMRNNGYYWRILHMFLNTQLTSPEGELEEWQQYMMKVYADILPYEDVPVI